MGPLGQKTGEWWWGGGVRALTTCPRRGQHCGLGEKGRWKWLGVQQAFSDGVVGLERLGAGRCCAAREAGWSRSPLYLPPSPRALGPARRGLMPVLSQWPREGHMGSLPEGLFLFT